MDLNRNFWIKRGDTVEYSGILSEKRKFDSTFGAILRVHDAEIISRERYLFFEVKNNSGLLMTRDLLFKKINKGVVS